MINVTKTYLPDFDEYVAVLKRAWDKSWITNNGELVQELEEKLRKYTGTENLLYCSNGTVVLQMALKALGITKEVITTPFSYVATTNVILWEGCTPIFADIDKDTFCIDPDKIEALITEDTEAILATHVYGIPCDVERIEAIAAKHNLKVIYDAAHAFGCTYKGRSLLTYGDVSTCSFHATKVFHTVEGGCITCNDNELSEKLSLYRSFGHSGDDYFSVGINAKNSEFHAAMGLALFPKIPNLIAARKTVFELYNQFLSAAVGRLNYSHADFEYNYAYYPALFSDERTMKKVKDSLEQKGINTRRYFYPSLNTVPQLEGKGQACPVSEDISSRILSLPLYPGLSSEEVKKICDIINAAVA